ncbi:MAG: hypothetical protein ABI878_10875 [Acidobacteriota bacterium]
MNTFVRHILPITYFQATRLNRWDLVAYNGLVEWLPALGLSYFYNGLEIAILGKVALSYLAFISVYEVGYITNDVFSERFETKPRGRAEEIAVSTFSAAGLIGARLIYFLFFTYILGAWSSTLWWTFYATLAVTFALHNCLPSEFRIATFFGLSTFRFFAPIILTLGTPVLTILLPTILLNNSLYRMSVYLGNKGDVVSADRQNVRFKFAFYAGCFPLSILFSFFFSSILPALVCGYFLLVWVIYWLASEYRKKGQVLS